MKLQRRLSLAAVAVLAGAHVAAQAAGNLVANGGFESGDFAGWTLSGVDVDAGNEGNLFGVEGVDPFPLPGGTAPHGGVDQAFFADQTANATTLTQTIATVAGTTYTISFWLAQAIVGPGSGAAAFSASFGGSGFTSITASADQAYREVTFTGQATQSSTALAFSFGNDVGEYLIDDISVTAPAVPEPSSLAMAGLGLLLLARRRRPGAAR